MEDPIQQVSYHGYSVPVKHKTVVRLNWMQNKAIRDRSFIDELHQDGWCMSRGMPVNLSQLKYKCFKLAKYYQI